MNDLKQRFIINDVGEENHHIQLVGYHEEIHQRLLYLVLNKPSIFCCLRKRVQKVIYVPFRVDFLNGGHIKVVYVPFRADFLNEGHIEVVYVPFKAFS